MSDAAKTVCIDCGTKPPSTNTNYTLISSDHGWRLARRTTADGTKVTEWRCPECWKKHKAKTGVTSGVGKGTPR